MELAIHVCECRQDRQTSETIEINENKNRWKGEQNFNFCSFRCLLVVHTFHSTCTICAIYLFTWFEHPSTMPIVNKYSLSNEFSQLCHMAPGVTRIYEFPVNTCLVIRHFKIHTQHVHQAPKKPYHLFSIIIYSLFIVGRVLKLALLRTHRGMLCKRGDVLFCIRRCRLKQICKFTSCIISSTE